MSCFYIIFWTPISILFDLWTNQGFVGPFFIKTKCYWCQVSRLSSVLPSNNCHFMDKCSGATKYVRSLLMYVFMSEGLLQKRYCVFCSMVQWWFGLQHDITYRAVSVWIKLSANFWMSVTIFGQGRCFWWGRGCAPCIGNWLDFLMSLRFFIKHFVSFFSYRVLLPPPPTLNWSPMTALLSVCNRLRNIVDSQVEMHYNLPRPDAGECPFKTTLKISEKSEKNDYSYEMKICTR